MTFISAIVLLGILIFVHELGHFLFAKLMKVKVLKFSLGFGPSIISRTYGDTEYKISALPLGGYVKMLGEDHETELTEQERKFAFNHQPVWKRTLIVFAGPAFNLLFAMVVFMFIFGSGVPALHPTVGEVLEGSAAQKAGLIEGDRVIRIADKDIAEWAEMTDIIYGSPEKTLDFRIKRGEEVIELKITPEKKTVKNIFGEDKDIGLIGIKSKGETFTKDYSVPEAVYLGIKRTVEVSVLTVMGIIKLIQRVVPAKTIGGPIMIFQMAGEQASAGAGSFFLFMAFISVNLGIINLIPIPVLDGGHLMFFAIEAARGKPLSEKSVMTAQKVGLAALLALMAFAVYNDIMRIITGEMP